MQEHSVEFLVDAPRSVVWRTFHPPVPTDAPSPRVIEYPGGRIEILFKGDEAGQGLVRICTFAVPKYLLSGGVATSWECITEARVGELSRYTAVGKPLWSRAEGWHSLEDAPDGRTRLTFHETYHANNPVLRALFERRVHAFISSHNDRMYRSLLQRLGGVERVSV
jgi:hypothetical protein